MARDAKTKLVLFDIDGTLLTSGGAGERALGMAVAERFGEEAHGGADPAVTTEGRGALKGIEIAGRTDTAIARRIFEKHGIEPSPAELNGLLESYLRHLELELPRSGGSVLPGIFELLEALKRRPDVALALLTGNLMAGAKLKLMHYGMWHFFEFGAFADDHHDRNELGRFAQERALKRHGVAIDAAHTFVLGDTPHDIDCGKAFGAKTVAIATGRYSIEELRARRPDFLFQDLSNVDEVLSALGI
jgi:phosphoglycolate phosphatase